jgi:hypothetical protein
VNTVAPTMASPTLDSKVDPRFGRSAHGSLVNPDTMAWEAVKNLGRGPWDDVGVRAPSRQRGSGGCR